ncbi:hypothetical protein [Janthinobacterium aquaticum]|uniref:hypothetical protein n=1 Tax=Janthinobacterium sp. FT58W TaxID=2654254 RepID=UPI001263F30B|nr:hypothetical protein [Janthinobacterium sp. FT58W]KAB8045046.1 hypothetical protein GCM43_01015 [Janthinobacterium sp. FT58W]
MQAYHSNPTVRDDCIAQLRKQAEQKRLAPGPLAWNGEKGSLIGCLLESEDLVKWENDLGLPQWLATTADGIAAQQQTIDDALDFGIRLLNAIRPGADVSPAASAVILSVLADARAFVGQSTDVPAELDAVLQQVQSLQQQVMAGQRPVPADWRAARRSATGVTDGLDSELLQSLAVCVETAAWDPSTSKAVVYDTLRVYSKAAISKADVESGYTKEDDTNIRTHLKLMWDTHLASKPELQEQGITVFSLLAEHHPDVHDKIVWKNRIDRDAIISANRRAADVLIEQLKQA